MDSGLRRNDGAWAPTVTSDSIRASSQTRSGRHPGLNPDVIPDSIRDPRVEDAGPMNQPQGRLASGALQ